MVSLTLNAQYLRRVGMSCYNPRHLQEGGQTEPQTTDLNV